jgi:hypothetical protein
MPMHLIETMISETAVRMRYADQPEPARATEWVDFQVKLADLMVPTDPGELLENPESHYLATIRLAALRRARDVIDGENERLLSLAGRKA